MTAAMIKFSGYLSGKTPLSREGEGPGVREE
jgi:hypothetical protein